MDLDPDTEVWLECQLCFRCYYDRWYFRDHCRIYHRRRPKADSENIIRENVPESEGILPSSSMNQNTSNNAGSVKPVIYRSNLKKVKTNTAVAVQPEPIVKRRGRPKGSINRVNNEISDVKTKLRTKSIKKRTRMVSNYFRNKFRITTLRRLASKVLIENNLTDKLSPENLKMVYFEKKRGRPPTPKKKGEKLNPFFQSLQHLKKRRTTPPKRYSDKRCEIKANPEDSPRRGRGRPRKIVDFRPYFFSPKNSPAKSPIKMKIIRSTPAVKNLDFSLGVTTRPKFSYHAMLKGRESSQNLENVQSPLKSPSKNVPAKIAAKFSAKKFPPTVSEYMAKKYSSNEQGELIGVIRKDTNITKSQDTSPQIKKKRGRPKFTIIPNINPTNTKYMTRKGKDRDDQSKSKRIRRFDELDFLETARTFDWKNYGEKLKSKSGQDFYKCYICNKKILSLRNFYYHNLIHTGEKPLKCQFCDMGFSHGQLRHKHEEKHNKVQTHTNQMKFKRSQNLERNANINRIKAKFSKSKIPDDELALLESMRNFKWENHGVKIKSKSGHNVYQCLKCSKIVTTIRSLFNHTLLETGEKPLKCRFCNQRFRQAIHRNKHEANIHEIVKNKKFAKSVANSNTVKENTQNKAHKTEKQNKKNRKKRSTILFKSIKRKKSKIQMREDEIEYFENIKNYDWKIDGREVEDSFGNTVVMCLTCNKNFRYKSLFYEHMLVHWDAYPFKCLYCEKKFRFIRSRRPHEEKNHLTKKRFGNIKRIANKDSKIRMNMNQNPSPSPTKSVARSLDSSNDKNEVIPQVPVQKPVPIRTCGNREDTEIKKMMQNFSELTFEKVVVDILDSPVGTSTRSSANSVNTPAKDAFPTPDVLISVVELKK